MARTVHLSGALMVLPAAFAGAVRPEGVQARARVSLDEKAERHQFGARPGVVEDGAERPDRRALDTFGPAALAPTIPR